MNKKIIGAGIGLGLMMILIFIAITAKKEYVAKDSSALKSVTELISKDKLDEAKDKLDEMKDKKFDSILLGKMYFKLGNSYEEHQNFVKARDMYGIILNEYQNVDNILDVQERLGNLNIKILFSQIITDSDIKYKIEPGDTLSKIAKQFGTTIDLIKISNDLTSDTIRAHSKLKISKNKYKILVDKSQNLLTILTDDDIVFKAYRVATGKNNSTPVGIFPIINKIKDPVWYTQGAIVPAESPDNILGSRWLGFSNPGYGIHGTTLPDSVGSQATKGCIRMFNAEVEELYTIIPVGIEVSIVD